MCTAHQENNIKSCLRVSIGLTVNRQTVKKVTVNRQLNQVKLVVKSLEYLLSRTIIASNNGVK